MIGLIMFAIDDIDLVGSKSAADAMVHDVIMQAGNQSGLWPDHDALRGQEAEQADIAADWRARRPDGVTLVLWTDDAMAQMKEYGYSSEIWPISYATHAEALYQARELGAKAIFLDFVFLSKRVDDTWQELDKEIRSFEKSEVPLFIACDLAHEGPPAFRDMVEAVAAANAGAGETIVSFVPATLPGTAVVRDYDISVPLPVPVVGERDVGPAGEVSADAATQCGGAGVLPARDPEAGRVTKTVGPTLYATARPKRAAAISADTPPMSIVWDRRSHVVTRTLFAPEEPYRGEQNWFQRQWCLLYGLLFDMSVLSRPLSGPPMMPGNYLVLPEEPRNKRSLSSEDLIKGRTVIIGSAQQSAADVRNTPNAMARPGALVHAVALDNLFKFDLEYVREQTVSWAFTKNALLILFAVAAAGLIYFLLNFAVSRQDERCQERVENSRRIAKTFFLKCMALFCTVSASVFSFFYYLGFGKSDAILGFSIFLSSFVYSILIEKKPWSRDAMCFLDSLRYGYIGRLIGASAIGLVVFFAFSWVLMDLRVPPVEWFSSLLAFSFAVAPLFLVAVSALLAGYMWRYDGVVGSIYSALIAFWSLLKRITDENRRRDI